MTSRFRVGGSAFLVWLCAGIAACGSDDDSNARPSGGGNGGSGGTAAAGGSGGSGATGGSGGGGSPGTAPSIVSQSPEPSSLAWYGEPIDAVFSEALDPASVSESSVTLLANGEMVPATVELSSDGTTVTVTPSATPAPADDGSLKAVLTVELGPEIVDLEGDAFAGGSWSWELPLWYRPLAPATGDDAALLPSVASSADGELWISLVEDGALMVERYDAALDAWEARGAGLNVVQGAEIPSQELRFVGGVPHVAWIEAGAQSVVHVKHWDGSAWVALGGAAVGSDAGQQLALRSSGDAQPVLAWQDQDGNLLFRAWDGSAWAELAPALSADSAGGIGSFDVQVSGTGLVVAYETADFDVAVVSNGSGDWQPVGAEIERNAGDASSVSLAVDGDTLLLGYIDGDGESRTAQVRRFDADANAWLKLGSALNLAELGGVPAAPNASHLRLASAAGRTLAGLVERTPDGALLYVAELTGSEFRFLGPALGEPASVLASFSLALDANGNPELAWHTERGIELGRYNDSPEPPYGLTERAASTECSLPADDDPAFPTTLGATGCYADVAARTPAPGLVPYDVNSALWSDGAAKRRFIVLPPGTSITYTEQGAWGMPPGAIVIKEFWIEGERGNPNSLLPMETRFLVKRCDETEPTCLTAWQGYSYQWNDDGTDATLLPDGNLEQTKAWPVTVDGMASTHEHIYPTRGQCGACHNSGAGRVLGLQTGQLNRPRKYGTTVDNQLRAMNHIGLFGDTFPAEQPEAVFRLPSPIDVGHDLERRVRSYFHSNCSHCHQPGAAQNTIDFRFGSPATADNICNFLEPGNPAGSPIYVKDATRGMGQMPPIASNIPDSRQLSLTEAWISNMSSCP